MPESRSTILIVDDSQTMLRAARKYLSQFKLNVLGTEGLALVRARAPDLVLSDIVMPELDGYTFLAWLHADSALARIPVVPMTAIESMKDRICGVTGSGCGKACKITSISG